MSHRSLIFSIIALSLAWPLACKSEGSFSGDLNETEQPASKPSASKQPRDISGTTADTTKHPAAPTPKHERVPFDWQSTDGGQSGSIQTTLPDGETYSGHFHQITSATTVDTVDNFYGSWYADPWAGPGWMWDGDWPYYGPDEYIKYYSGRIVAVLTSNEGDAMRCHFRLDDPDRGMKGGGQGDCQLSNGERVTAVFPAV